MSMEDVEKGNAMKISRVCTVGAGCVGVTTSAVLALKNPTIEFTVVDTERARTAQWNSSQIPIDEPALKDILNLVHCDSTYYDGFDIARRTRPQDQGRSRNLTFSSKIEEYLSQADLIIVAVDTPALMKCGADGCHKFPCLDLRKAETVIATLAQVCTKHTIVVIKSTVSPGWSDTAAKHLTSHSVHPGASFTVISSPELLAQTTAVQNVLEPDCLVFGLPSILEPDPTTHRAIEALKSLYNPWIPEAKILPMSRASAELFKLANNALLAQRLSSINSIAAICERLKFYDSTDDSDGHTTDIRSITRALSMNTRLGSGYLQPGPGFGGSCLAKDTSALAHLADHLGLHDEGVYWNGVIDVNNGTQERFFRRILTFVSARPKSGAEKTKIAVLGFAFKTGATDSRESVSKRLVLRLLDESPGDVQVSVYDPHMSPEEIRRDVTVEVARQSASAREDPTYTAERDWNGGVIYATSAQTACDGASIVAVVNDEAEFADVDWEDVVKGMVGPKALVDARRGMDVEWNRLERFGARIV